MENVYNKLVEFLNNTRVIFLKLLSSITIIIEWMNWLIGEPVN
jgi:hypothetical protein